MRLLLAFIGILFVSGVYGANERYTNRIEGAAIAVNQSFELFDDRYTDMATNVNWSSQYTNYKVKNKVTLGLNKKVVQVNTFTGTIVVNITFDTWNGTAFVPQTVTKSLIVSNTLNPTTQIDDLSTYIFEGGHHIKVQIQSISAGITVTDLFIESEINVERYYPFDGNVVTGVTHQNSGANDEFIEFVWPSKAGAEYYEIEWVHINDYTKTPNTYIDPQNLNYNFYLNSTRLSIKSNYYRIPKVFDHGYLLFRVRAVGVQSSDITKKKEGRWNAPETGIVALFSHYQKIAITTEYDIDMNWSHQIGYVEDGKRVESISFMDGLGRGRQSVGLNPETKQALVNNVYYDELGRPVISDLTTPVDGEQLKHYKDFNRANLPGEPSFMATYFDTTYTDSCNLIAQGFSINYGAGNYYSSSNPNRFDENANIPDAKGHPYSRVQYLDDYTGRVVKVSGTGKDLRLGSGHETEFAYPSADQIELSRLFGTEVGYKDHYEKMVTVDPNGQIYVQYTDMAGRVVVSYMAGKSPNNVSALPDNIGQIVTSPIVSNGIGQAVYTTPPYSEVNYSPYIYNEGLYKINYNFTPQQYTTTCNTICFDCVYDLELKVTDDCGHIIWSEIIKINGASFDAICNGATSYTYNDATGNAYKELSLLRGQYNVYKKLSVNQAAIDDYWCLYLANNTCLEPLTTTFNNLYTAEPFAVCNSTDLVEPETGECDDYATILAMDMTPGGQYAKYTEIGGVYSCTDRASIFYTGIDRALHYYWSSFDYFDVNGQPITVSINGGPQVSPKTLSMADFINHFDPSWATALISNHPEYCYLQFCRQNNGSHDYDNLLKAEYSYNNANTNGYFRPFNSGLIIPSNVSSSFSSNVYLDPFFSTQYGAPYAQQMINEMNHYIDIQATDGIVALSIWEYANMIAYDPNYTSNPALTVAQVNWVKSISRSGSELCLNDLIWTSYRDLYLELKEAYVFKAEQDYANANNCSNSCIGAISICAAPKDVLAAKAPRFGNLDVFGDAATSYSNLQSDVTDQTATSCQTSCESFADDWIQRLQGCDYAAHNVNMTNFRNSLIALCTSGCDVNHPTGSSTSITGTHINDILVQYGLNPSSICTELLISDPQPYRPTSDMLGAFQIPLDECACTKLNEAATLFANTPTASLPVGVTYKEQMLAYMTGVDLEDIDRLLCACSRKAINYDGWIYSSSGTLINPKYPIDSRITCETGSERGCLSWPDIQDGINSLQTTFGYSNYTALQTMPNFETILTNYFNNLYFYNLSFADYSDFISGCRASIDSPYCKITEEAKEFVEVIKLIAFRGQIISTAPLHLLQENIVFAHGKLKNILAGDSYWTQVSGNVLTMNFGNSHTNCSILLTKPSTFNFTDIVSFGTIIPSSTNCGANNSFSIHVQYTKCGKLVDDILQGTSNCFDISKCICGDAGQLLCNKPLVASEEACYQPQLDNMYQNAEDHYAANVANLYTTFKNEYNTKCAQAFSTENMAYTGATNVYQYTLFYYDQAGNLVKTIAPEGIDFNYQANFNATAVSTALANKTQNIPSHTYQTTYKYNSYNQLVETANPDQDGATKYWYDIYGRIVASQNPVQAAANMYSYSLYDKPGRPVEVGQVQYTTLTESVVKVKEAIPGNTFKSWVYHGIRTEVTKTVYDKPFSTAIAAKFANGQQENLRLRVASVLYYENGTDANYTSAIHYSYDLHGNVIEQLQDIPQMVAVAQDVKSTQYEFKLLSCNVSKVSYQKGKNDYMAHCYEYDKLNRLTEVFTTTNDVQSSREAHYRYYDYGPMARTEIGEYKVQGMDYAYTINGWLKGMNASTLDVTRDMGHDGSTGYLPSNTSVHSEFAKDVVGYTMGYFAGDYRAIGASSMEASYIGTPFDLASANLYNGNIRHLVTSIQGMATMGTANSYDQLNRLKEMTAYYNGAFTTNNWTGGTATQEYFNKYNYDRNGNITYLKRNGIGTQLNMDEFTYNYIGLDGLANATSTRKSNRLDKVDDIGQNYMNGAVPVYGDIKSGQAGGNYQYDKLGQLVADASEGITAIDWRKGDKKIKRLSRTSGSNASELEYVYNPFGQRVLKIEKPKAGGVVLPNSNWKYSYYSYDANGQVMAVYEATISAATNKATVDERHIYGASRIGMLDKKVVLFDQTVVAVTTPDVFQNTLGDKRFEITNHLGNVNAVITDRKIYSGPGAASLYEPVTLMKADYYPFGMEMPGRNSNTSEYRFAYNGMEKDPEMKGEGNSYTTEFRQYDPRLGRWMSLDPLMSMFPWMSPYVAFNNNPILLNDPLGLAADKGGDDQDKKNEKDAKSQGLPDDAKHEQVSTGKNGKQYQYIEGEGGKGSWGEYKGDGAVVNASKKGGDDHASKPEENHSMMNSFFGVSNDGSFATDKISVYEQSNYDYCNSNPTILQNRLEANNRENGLLTYAGVSLAAPFVVFGVIEAAPIAFATLRWGATTTWTGLKIYHNTFGKYGGEESLLGETVNQTGNQLGKTGTISFNEYDIIGLSSSAFVTNNNPYSKFIQGNLGTFISYSKNGGYDGLLSEKGQYKSNSWKIMTVINANFSTYFYGGLFKDYSTGVSQGVIDKVEENGGFK